MTTTKPRYHVHHIRTKPGKMYEYYVTGPGHFPFDMLRYDSCWPATGEDVAAMEEPGQRSVKLYSYSEPTIERWISFLWSVGTERLF